MNNIHDFESFHLLEMKNTSRRKLEAISTFIRRRMLANPSGALLSDIFPELRNMVPFGVEIGLLTKYVDNKGDTRVILNNRDSRFVDPREKETLKPLDSNQGKRIVQDSNTEFMFQRANFKKLARTLPKADYIIGKIMKIEIGDTDSMSKLEDAVRKYYGI